VVRKPAAEAPVEETRRRAIDAAIACLAELGYGQATLQVIAQRAGMSHGPLQYHFRSKPGLMAAVAERLLADRRRSFAPLVAPPAGRAREGSDLLADYLGLAQDYGRTPEFLAAIELLVASRSDPELREAIAEVVGSRRRTQQETFARLLADQMGAEPSRLLAVTDLVTSLAAGFAMNRSVGALSQGREEQAWRLLGDLLGGWSRAPRGRSGKSRAGGRPGEA